MLRENRKLLSFIQIRVVHMLSTHNIVSVLSILAWKGREWLTERCLNKLTTAVTIN